MINNFPFAFIGIPFASFAVWAAVMLFSGFDYFMKNRHVIDFRSVGNVKAEIISVGTELLLGQICNTNAQYLSKRLLGSMCIIIPQ